MFENFKKIKIKGGYFDEEIPVAEGFFLTRNTK